MSSASDDDRTTVMSRGVLPFPKRRAPMDAEERTTIATPAPRSSQRMSQRPAVAFVATIDEQTQIGHAAFPKASATMSTPPSSFRRSTLLNGTQPVPVPPRPTTPVPGSIRATRSVAPPPLPVMQRAGHDSRTMVAAPRASQVPPPPPSATRLHEGAARRRADVPSEPPSAPVFVRDALPSSPSVAPVVGSARVARREPMLVLAACAGMLGMIFTLGIVVGLVVSLRGKTQVAVAAAAPPSHAAASLSIAPAAAPVEVAAPVAAAPAAPAVAAPVVAKVEAPAKEAPKAVEAPKPEAPAPVRVAHHVAAAPAADAPVRVRPAPVAASAVASAPAPKATAAAKKHVAMPSDPDFDAANAANDLARAQLEASLH